MRGYDMKAVYTVAAVPTNPDHPKANDVVPLPVEMRYTLADALEIAKMYSSKYSSTLQRLGYSHFVPFNLEALEMPVPSGFRVGDM